MKDYLFTIVCTTCQAELKVREKGLIGQIVACPKCGSMVEVTPPEAENDGVGSSASAEPKSPHEGRSTPPESAPTKEAAPLKKAVPPPLPPSAMPDKAAKTRLVEPGQPGKQEAPSSGETPASEEAVPVEQIAWRRRVWMIAGGVAAVLLLGGVYFLFISPGRNSASSPDVASDEPKTVVPSEWIPQEADLIVRLTRGAADEQEIDRVISSASPGLNAAVARFLEAFGLRRDRIEEVTVAATGAPDSPERAVITIRLREGQDARLLETTGKTVSLDLAELKWFRRPSGWANPFAILDKRTFVTGPEKLLKTIVAEAKSGKKADSASPLLGPLSETWSLAVVIRGSMWKDATAPWVSAWLAAWPSVADAWKKVAGSADGVACFLSEDPAKCRIGFASSDEASAGQLSDQATVWLDAMKETMVPEESIKASQLVGKAVGALHESSPTTKGASVWVDATIDPPPVALLADLADDARGLGAWWLLAGRSALETKQGAASTGLRQFAEKNGTFPQGVVGEGLLPPETRLSWIASMLPFYGHPDWVKDVDFSYGWKDEQNAGVTKRPLAAVVNPILGPQVDDEGFPVTHFVGVAGVGPDAAELPKGDPAAGIFGYGRQTSLDDIKDGAANTLAILGVIEELGPWAAGGKGTIRGISGRPVVSGPAGFGSGLPDGMIAGMADGSVRFISKDVDPRVLEQMATISGGEGKKPAPEPGPADAGKPDAADAGKPEAAEPKPAVDEQEASANAEVKIRLAERFPRVVHRQIPLEKVLDDLGRLGNIRIRIDEPALEARNISAETPVTVDKAEASLDDLLRQVLRQVNLSYRIEKGGVTVFPAE